MRTSSPTRVASTRWPSHAGSISGRATVAPPCIAVRDLASERVKFGPRRYAQAPVAPACDDVLRGGAAVYPHARRMASAIPPPSPVWRCEHVGRLRAHGFGRAAHHERAARDLEHRHVVDPVADDDRLARRCSRGARTARASAVPFVGPAARTSTACLPGTHETGKLTEKMLARVPVQHGVRGGDCSASPIATAASGSLAHTRSSSASSTTRIVRRPRAHVAARTARRLRRGGCRRARR